MTCNEIEQELVAYHFGLVEGEARGAIEAHLPSCAACVRAFVEIKRAVETGAEGPAPSKASRARLRSAVAGELGIATKTAPGARRRWWERPVAFAIAASAVLVAGMTTHALTSGPGAPPYAVSEGRYNHAP